MAKTARRAVELRDDQAVEPNRVAELPRLLQAVLARRGVEHEHRRHGVHAVLVHHAADLL
jgi:hypothetical protein